MKFLTFGVCLKTEHLAFFSTRKSWVISVLVLKLIVNHIRETDSTLLHPHVCILIIELIFKNFVGHTVRHEFILRNSFSHSRNHLSDELVFKTLCSLEHFWITILTHGRR